MLPFERGRHLLPGIICISYSDTESLQLAIGVKVYVKPRSTLIYPSAEAKLLVEGMAQDGASGAGCSRSAFICDCVLRTVAGTPWALEVAREMYVERLRMPTVLSRLLRKLAGDPHRVRSQRVMELVRDYLRECLPRASTTAPQAGEMRSMLEELDACLTSRHRGNGLIREFREELTERMGFVSSALAVEVLFDDFDAMGEFSQTFSYAAAVVECSDPDPDGSKARGQYFCERGGAGRSWRPEPAWYRAELLARVVEMTVEEGGIDGPKPSQRRHGPTTTFRLKDHSVRFPSDWIVLNPSQAPASSWTLVTETRNGGLCETSEGFGVPHFICFLDRRPSELSKDELSAVVADEVEAWPAMMEVLEQDGGPDGVKVGHFCLESFEHYVVEGSGRDAS